MIILSIKRHAVEATPRCDSSAADEGNRKSFAATRHGFAHRTLNRTMPYISAGIILVRCAVTNVERLSIQSCGFHQRCFGPHHACKRWHMVSALYIAMARDSTNNTPVGLSSEVIVRAMKPLAGQAHHVLVHPAQQRQGGP